MESNSVVVVYFLIMMTLVICIISGVLGWVLGGEAERINCDKTVVATMRRDGTTVICAPTVMFEDSPRAKAYQRKK